LQSKKYISSKPAKTLAFNLFYLGFYVQSMLSVKRAVLFKLNFALGIPPVLFCCIVFPLALRTLERDKFNSGFFACHNAS
jgi:hypothetical protein